MWGQDLGSAFLQVLGRTHIDRPQHAITACVQAEDKRDILFIREVLGEFLPSALINKAWSTCSPSLCGLVICLPESRAAVTGLCD